MLCFWALPVVYILHAWVYVVDLELGTFVIGIFKMLCKVTAVILLSSLI